MIDQDPCGMLGQAASPESVFWSGSAAFFLLLAGAHRAVWIRIFLLVIPLAMLVGFALLGDFDGIRAYVNWTLGPEQLLLLSSMLLVLALLFYRQWTRPRFALAILIGFTVAYVASGFDPNFRKIIGKPDNVPITLMIFSVGLCLWVAFRQAAINDERSEKGEPLLEAGSDDKVLVWPDLVYEELVCLVLCTALLNVWAIMLRAPLEPAANPAVVPNPSKAPWYFLGLQEMLVYFDPWIAGVLLPGLIIGGLIALPYIDKNPKGNGYYTLKERPFAISVFMVGFVILWVLMITLGTFMRGPNWNFFGPYEYWDPHQPAALVNVNLSEIFWIKMLGRAPPNREIYGGAYYLVREAPGIIALLVYFVGGPALLAKTVFRKLYVQMGPTRFAVMMVLFTWMALVPIKMLLRWLFNLKYILAITEWFFNV